ncbi:MAG: metal-binding protein [Pyrinomonadaceae bacterium]
MPSGRFHDAATFLLTAPAFAGTYAYTRSVASSAIVAAAFLFGGLMFGPDLDTVSRQYSRWSILRGIWYPYRSFFKHRSRFSHGLLLGALIRVIYFMGIVTLTASAAVYISTVYAGERVPGLTEFPGVWQPVGRFMRETLGENFLLLTFIGLWLGAASHTFTDMAGSFIKTGRAAKFF